MDKNNIDIHQVYIRINSIQLNLYFLLLWHFCSNVNKYIQTWNTTYNDRKALYMIFDSKSLYGKLLENGNKQPLSVCYANGKIVRNGVQNHKRYMSQLFVYIY